MSAAACTFKMGWDTNGINACKTSPKAFPPLMLFADAPNEMSQRTRSPLYAELTEGRPATGPRRDPPDAAPISTGRSI